MGDGRKQALCVQSDSKLRLEFRGAKITSDAGLLAFRELDEAFRLTEKGSTRLSDCRRGKNTRRSLLGMLRQSVYGRLAGYEDVNPGAPGQNICASARRCVAYPSSNDTAIAIFRHTSEVMRRSPSRRCTVPLRPKASSTPSASRPMMF